MPSDSVHIPLTRHVIRERMISLWRSEYLFRFGQREYEETFRGSMDRFIEIAERLQECRRALDVGTGLGILPVFLKALGHEVEAVDFTAPSSLLREKAIPFVRCHAEVDRLPFDDGTFDAVTCCQCLEHFTHSPLFAVREFHRVLRPGGCVEVDVPNAVCFRNRWRMLRGKHITWDFEKHYLHTEPVLYQGRSFFPDRHNREFTLEEVKTLLRAAGFRGISAWHLRSRRYRTGWDRLRNIGTALRDSVPSLRKTIIAFGQK